MAWPHLSTEPYPPFLIDAQPRYLSQVCFRECASQNALYFIVLFGDTCDCGFDPEFLDDEQDIGVRDAPCAGDASLLCGGQEEQDSYDLYYLQDG